MDMVMVDTQAVVAVATVDQVEAAMSRDTTTTTVIKRSQSKPRTSTVTKDTTPITFIIHPTTTNMESMMPSQRAVTANGSTATVTRFMDNTPLTTLTAQSALSSTRRTRNPDSALMLKELDKPHMMADMVDTEEMAAMEDMEDMVEMEDMEVMPDMVDTMDMDMVDIIKKIVILIVIQKHCYVVKLMKKINK
jgi:nicotinamide mononucleotide adenylyltransferase